jgi:large subunit ribosomal protein L24
MVKVKIKRGDRVRVLTGKDRGKQAVVLAVLPNEGRIMVEGVNMIHKHVRARRAGEKGQRVTLAAPLPISNVQLICPACKRGTRVGMRREGDRWLRQCKQCEATIAIPKVTS